MNRRLRKKLAKRFATYRIVQVDVDSATITLDRVVDLYPYPSSSLVYPPRAKFLRAERNRAMRLQAGRPIVIVPEVRT